MGLCLSFPSKGTSQERRSGVSTCQQPSAFGEGVLAGRFRVWIGASGARLMFSVFPAEPERLSDFSDAVLLAVARTDRGLRIVAAMETSHTPSPAMLRVFTARAAAGAAVEWHVHFLAASPRERRSILEDLTDQPLRARA